ncbi:MAG TPA: hypothetical protein QGI59_03045 [Candidatus Poseidoniia archaeon]|nr:hypothetical protein [Candidatus Poseidoniia archaeon]|tara:strand:+ start:1937 stop:2497 length:561 start_codon:yes stop_codon:yes gene_type:complete
MEKKEFLIKVNDDVYGPIPLDRIINDVKNGELTKNATFFDNDDWIPVLLLLEENIYAQPWNEDNWVDKKEDLLLEDGPPLPASSAWEDITRKGRWLMIYGDHLVIEGGDMNLKSLGLMMEGEPLSGGIPMKKLINVTFKDNEKGVNILASSFHKMYEVYTLECCLSKDDSNELMKELQEANVRIIS